MLISKTEQPTGPAAWLVSAEALPSQVRRTCYATGARAARNLSPTQVSDAPPRASARAHPAQSRHWQWLLMSCCSIVATAGCPPAAAAPRSSAHPAKLLLWVPQATSGDISRGTDPASWKAAGELAMTHGNTCSCDAA